MSKSNSFQEKFKNSVEKYLEVAKVMPGNLPISKGVITKVINAWLKQEEPSRVRDEIKEVFSCLEVDDYCMRRFFPGPWYEEKGVIYGWYSDDVNVQFQAEELPLTVYPEPVHVNFLPGFRLASLGFSPPWPLPLQRTRIQIKNPDERTESVNRSFIPMQIVKFPFELSEEMAKYGFANPCKIQWHWSREIGGIVVDRSIISHGFWCAWKWHTSSRDWFLENSPELFEDFGWWDRGLTRYDPPEFYAAVLGGNEEYQARLREEFIAVDE